MKIVQIVTQMESGGAQRVAILLNKALQSRGYDAEVWFLYLKRPTYVNDSGVRVLLEHKPSGLEYSKIFSKLQQMLRFHQPDVVITHTHYANLIGQLASKLCTVPKRIAVQQNPMSSYPWLARWGDWLFGSTNIYSYNIAVSQAVVDSATKYPSAYKQKLNIIYNGTNYPDIEVSPQEVRKFWELPENAPLLINVGRLSYQKNQQILLEALARIDDAHLVILGEGELRENLQQKTIELQLQQRVHFLGELPSHQVFSLLRVANVFVFPSLFEGTPMALVEAIGAGLPVVASNIPVMHEVLEDAGIFVSPDNAKQLATSIQQILDFPELAQSLSLRSLERARIFSLENMVDAYEKLIC
ncbi:glycosyltransferase [Chroococcidiopsis thermalis]|uniref:Glycosyl transferase group 1 n=1 Tax=Chroococcidiopsis thermalis (strain PCC 7203) TaxID=251229 RepID=K9TXS1_CHRTP|nr:glycosyltransferase [Chroococcidiopsis thermalis]AFY87637.1 glycosyl transferase group 1 [Chroococcidiopsis thermalis PCC 7203]